MEDVKQSTGCPSIRQVREGVLNTLGRTCVHIHKEQLWKDRKMGTSSVKSLNTDSCGECSFMILSSYFISRQVSEVCLGPQLTSYSLYI
jgi:hypothetical protein